MRRKNRPSKQVDFRVQIGGMILLLAVVLPGITVQATAKTNEETLVYTSTESVLNKSYEELIDSLNQSVFEDYLATLEWGASYIIPGINNTNIRNEESCNGMIPQGLCVAGDYLLISAYDMSHRVTMDTEHKSEVKQKSVLYVMDVVSQTYLTTMTLDTKCHVGALAYNPDDEVIYVADSANHMVQMLSIEQIVECVKDGQDSKSEVVKFQEGAIDTLGYTPSFLAYYQEHLYVGQFARCKQEEWFSNRMVVFKRDGTMVEQDTIAIPYYAQGVAFADWKNKTYMLVSASYGRHRTGKLYVYETKQQRDGSLRRKRKVGEFVCPNMSEDIDVQGDRIYTCYESASNFYRLALDENGESSNVVDRVMVSSFNKAMGRLKMGNEEQYVQTLREIPLKNNRRNLIYLDADQRRRLFLRLF